MKRYTLFFALVAIAAACAPDQPSPMGPKLVGPSFAISVRDASDPTAGNYLVSFRGNSIPTDFAARVSAAGGQIIFAHAGAGVAAVSGLDATGAKSLSAAPGIASIDADAYTTLEKPSVTSQSLDDGIASVTNPAAALGFGLQWNMRAIRAPAAWSQGFRGSSSVRVGILDTGIDYLAKDLFGKVDFTLSRSFLSAAENARVESTFPGQGVRVIADLNGHGTLVAGTVSSNAVWFAGVTSGVKLVALKVCTPGEAPDFEGTCPTSGVLGAMLYAADNGLDVINMSLGGSFNRRDARAFPREGFTPSFIAVISQVFNYVNRHGTAVVVAAGNGDPKTGLGIDLDHDGNAYNAYCNAPHAICVSATGPTGGSFANPTNVDALAVYSNFGRSAITVAAPGGNALPIVGICSGFALGFDGDCQYTSFDPTVGHDPLVLLGAAGTSLAAPHVAGLAGLIAGQVGHNPSAIAARIGQSANCLGLGGKSAQYGAGRIDVARAMGIN
jgi:hypothetical protein